MGLPDDLTKTMMPKPWPREWMGNNQRQIEGKAEITTQEL